MIKKLVKLEIGEIFEGDIYLNSKNKYCKVLKLCTRVDEYGVIILSRLYVHNLSKNENLYVSSGREVYKINSN